jgi:hypothetical protein
VRISAPDRPSFSPAANAHEKNGRAWMRDCARVGIVKIKPVDNGAVQSAASAKRTLSVLPHKYIRAGRRFPAHTFLMIGVVGEVFTENESQRLSYQGYAVSLPARLRRVCLQTLSLYAKDAICSDNVSIWAP